MNSANVQKDHLSMGRTTLLTMVAYNNSGQEKGRLELTYRSMLIAACTVSFATIILPELPRSLSEWQRREEAAEMITTMKKLASEGHDAAALCFVKNYIPDNRQRPSALAQKEDPEAMFLDRGRQFRLGRIEQGQQPIANSAEKAFVPAIQHIFRSKE